MWSFYWIEVNKILTLKKCYYWEFDCLVIYLGKYNSYSTVLRFLLLGVCWVHCFSKCFLNQTEQDTNLHNVYLLGVSNLLENDSRITEVNNSDSPR